MIEPRKKEAKAEEVVEEVGPYLRTRPMVEAEKEVVVVMMVMISNTASQH
jgi:hypothetical protein